MRLEISKEIFFQRGGLLDRLLDNTFDQALIVDKDGRVIFFSKSSQDNSKIRSEDIVGKRIELFVPDAGFRKVLQTGIADRGTLTHIDGGLAIASHIPVFDRSELLGAIGIVYFSKLASLKKILSDLGAQDKRASSDLYHTISRHSGSYSFKDYIGESKVTKRLIEDTRSAAQSNYPILLYGETGTGKEILASAIHNENRETFQHPFVKINCSAIPETLLESELFGHEKGAFTGASAAKAGKFEAASGGSILLDEIGEMDLRLQAKLLRVLEEKEFERIGANRLIPANARVIVSTNANIPQLCQEKRFREDLYYRLNTLEIRVPALRERKEDIPLLLNHFVISGGLDIQFDEEATDNLMKYHWPGNVRQLRNLVSRFGVMKRGGIIRRKDVEDFLIDTARPSQMMLSNNLQDRVADTVSDNPELPRENTLEALEMDAIRQALDECKGNRSLTATKLSIGRSTLLRKMKKYGIT